MKSFCSNTQTNLQIQPTRLLLSLYAPFPLFSHQRFAIYSTPILLPWICRLPPSPSSSSSSSPGTHALTSPSHSWTIRFPPFYSQQFQSPEGFKSQVTSHNFRIFFSSLSLSEKKQSPRSQVAPPQLVSFFVLEKPIANLSQSHLKIIKTESTMLSIFFVVLLLLPPKIFPRPSHPPTCN